MSQETKTIIGTSLQQFMRDFQEHVQLGWEVDENNAPKMWGFAYETGLVRNDKTIAAMVTRIDENGQPKVVRSKAEILEVARRVKAEKREAAQGEAHVGT